MPVKAQMARPQARGPPGKTSPQPGAKTHLTKGQPHVTTDSLPLFSFKAAIHKLADRIKVCREAALRYALPSKMKGGRFQPPSNFFKVKQT